MEAKEMNIGENKGDRISKLPEEIRCSILSLLSTKEAAQTSVLSKKWRYSFTQRSTLEFDDSSFVPGGRSDEECIRSTFMEFVGRFMARQSPVSKLSLGVHKGVDQRMVEDWVSQGLKRGATDLTFIMLFPSTGYSLPPSIFIYAQQLVRLKLGRVELSLAEKDLEFTNLKILHLDSVEFGADRNKAAALFTLLLSKCPMLEEITVNGMKWHYWLANASLSSATLKRATIDCQQDMPSVYPYMQSPMYFQLGIDAPNQFSFDTPSLLYLNYCDFVAMKYPLVVLKSLVEARIDIGKVDDRIPPQECGYDVTGLIMGINNVERLELTSETLEVISDFCESIPVFDRLTHLSIVGDDERGWQALPLILIKCPNLHTLTFHGLHHRITEACGDVCDCVSGSASSLSTSCLSSCPVKILKILDFGATCGEMSMVEHFLKKLPQLGQVSIVMDFDSAHEEYFDLSKVTEALKKAPRASPSCEVEVSQVL